MASIWELGGGMVAPDDHVLDIIHRDPKTAGNLGLVGGNMLVIFQRIIITVVEDPIPLLLVEVIPWLLIIKMN